MCPQQLTQITAARSTLSLVLCVTLWHTNRCGVIIDMDYRHINSQPVGAGTEERGQGFNIDLVSQLSPSHTSAGSLLPLPHPPSLSELLLELWYFNKYWKSDCRLASHLCFQHLLFFQLLIDYNSSILQSYIVSEEERWKRDVKNIIFCTCQC